MSHNTDLGPTTDTAQNTLMWFEAARPEPTRKDFNVQLGVHFEEIGEMIDEISPQDEVTRGLVNEANNAVKALAQRLKTTPNGVVIKNENRMNFLDAIVDQLVTGIGSAHTIGMDPAGGLKEVNRSNWSKFDEEGKPILDENGKIAKGPNYVKADLSDFV